MCASNKINSSTVHGEELPLQLNCASQSTNEDEDIALPELRKRPSSSARDAAGQIRARDGACGVYEKRRQDDQSAEKAQTEAGRTTCTSSLSQAFQSHRDT
jgi:hypothetical protein